MSKVLKHLRQDPVVKVSLLVPLFVLCAWLLIRMG